jgi:DNA-directed RNA polymerase specialized sigma subunit
MRHGMSPYEKEMTFPEIGKCLNISGARARQRYVESINLLSHQEGIRMLA